MDPLVLSFVSACTALAASIVGPIVTLRVARRQFNATVLSTNRQKWIETLRDMVAELISLLVSSLVVRSAWKSKWDKGHGPLREDTALLNKLERIVLAQSKIRLLLNPTDVDHQQLDRAIEYRNQAVEGRGISRFGYRGRHRNNRQAVTSDPETGVAAGQTRNMSSFRLLK